MDRGRIILTTKELKALKSLELKEEPARTKFDAASKQNHDALVLISVDEAETILDYLPIPTNRDKPEITNLRKKINAFLLAFRQRHYELS